MRFQETLTHLNAYAVRALINDVTFTIFNLMLSALLVSYFNTENIAQMRYFSIR